VWTPPTERPGTASQRVNTMNAVFADKIDMQNRLFSELSRMFGQEVPLYDKSLLVNSVCNRAVCDLLAKLHIGFGITDEQLEKTSGERHGAIRIGRPDEYRLIARFFACFAMEPHNFYDMTSVGSKSQPIIATAFRSVLHPEHRVFSSLLQTNYFDPTTQARIEGLLAGRQVFSQTAKDLIDKSERQGGLSWDDATALIREGTDRIFKWTGKARDHQLYKELCDAGFKIAADIACFESHHLNHLTPNTFCMDLYTAAMKFCMGEMAEGEFRRRAHSALHEMVREADKDSMRLQFKHLTPAEIDGYRDGNASETEVAALVEQVTNRLKKDDLPLTKLRHSGFKDFTEGPSSDTPVLLRQDAYKALTEPVQFRNPDGTVIDTVHTARFGEIEQRFYATTIAGRALYDQCLTAAEAAKDADPGLIKRDFAAYEAMYASHFAAFPKTLSELLEKGLVLARYEPTAAGLAARGLIQTANIHELVHKGFARYEGLRYEDFLPVSAAGIFASNLNQYGTQSTAAKKPDYTQDMLESVMGRPIVSSDVMYDALQSESLVYTLQQLGVFDRLGQAEQARLLKSAQHCPPAAAHRGCACQCKPAAAR
jgi:uncharacterized glyoxalase superfamily metalloenzyme YdcJ